MKQMQIRNSAKAVIVQNGKLLVIRNHSGGKDWYLLPGGGQRHGETLIEALKRECFEEAAIRIIAGDILFIRDYISKNHEFAEEDGGAHQVEFMFRCRIQGSTEPAIGCGADKWQTGIAWIPLAEIDDYDLYPSQLKDILRGGIPENHPVYLGDIN